VVKRRLLRVYPSLCKPSQQQTDAGQNTTPRMRLEALSRFTDVTRKRAFSHVKPYRAASPRPVTWVYCKNGDLAGSVIRIYRYLTYRFKYNVEAEKTGTTSHYITPKQE
jgi:hypothetical protein